MRTNINFSPRVEILLDAMIAVKGDTSDITVCITLQPVDTILHLERTDNEQQVVVFMAIHISNKSLI